MLDQDFDDGDVSENGRSLNRRIAEGVLSINLGASFQQQTDDLLPILGCGNVERRLTVVFLLEPRRVDIRSFLD
jgi:hypothetical protein